MFKAKWGGHDGARTTEHDETGGLCGSGGANTESGSNVGKVVVVDQQTLEVFGFEHNEITQKAVRVKGHSVFYIVVGMLVGCCLCFCCIVMNPLCWGFKAEQVFNDFENFAAGKMRNQFDEQCPASEKAKYESEEFKLECSEIFHEIDRDKNGKLDMNELQTATDTFLCKPGFPAYMLMKAFDLDGDDTINQEEFVQLMRWASFMQDQTQFQGWCARNDMSAVVQRQCPESCGLCDEKNATNATKSGASGRPGVTGVFAVAAVVLGLVV